MINLLKFISLYWFKCCLHKNGLEMEKMTIDCKKSYMYLSRFSNLAARGNQPII